MPVSLPAYRRVGGSGQSGRQGPVTAGPVRTPRRSMRPHTTRSGNAQSSGRARRIRQKAPENKCLAAIRPEIARQRLIKASCHDEIRTQRPAKSPTPGSIAGSTGLSPVIDGRAEDFQLGADHKTFSAELSSGATTVPTRKLAVASLAKPEPSRRTLTLGGDGGGCALLAEKHHGLCPN